MLNKALTGKFKLAAVLATLGLFANAAPMAHAGQITAGWTFSVGGGDHALGTSQVFSSVNSPNTINPIAVTAYGEESTTKVTTRYNWNKPSSTSTVTTSKPTALYSKSDGGNETGLGLDNYAYHEIDNTVTTKGTDWKEIVTTTVNDFIQIDMSSVLAAVAPQDLSATDVTIIIGSVTGSDKWAVSASKTLGVIGNPLLQSGGQTGNTGFGNPAPVALSTFASDKYLTISALGGGSLYCDSSTSSVLLNSMTMTFTPNPSTIPAGPSVPTPASFGLLAVGGLAVASMLLRRRKANV